MNVLIVSGGYRGDVLPYVPIARALARRGHDVRVLVPSDFHRLLAHEPFDVPTAPGHDLGPAFLEQYAGYMARWGTRFGGIRVPTLMLRLVVEQLDNIIDAVDPHVRWADVMLTHPIAALSVAVSADQHDTPWAVGDLFPMLLPSGAAPPMGTANLGHTANRLAWRLARSSLFDRVSHASDFKAARRARGLDTDGWNLVDARISPYLNLGLASRHYVEPEPDWPAGYELVGFTHWTPDDDYVLPAEVARFLDDGPAPVAVTLGTSAASARPDIFESVARSLDRTRQRGLFLVSTTDNAQRLANTITPQHAVHAFIPLTAVLPRCRAVIHSGAHGTNALALQAGLPSAIQPVLQDQVWHANRQEQLGTGIRLRPRRVDNAIRRLIDDDNLAHRAQELATRLNQEDAPTTVAQRLERAFT